MSMQAAVERLESRVASAVELVASLRARVAALELQLAAPAPAAPEVQDQTGVGGQDPAFVEELERLRAERVVIRDGIRGLIAQIDQVAW